MRQATRKESIKLLEDSVEFWRSHKNLALSWLILTAINKSEDVYYIKHGMIQDKLIRAGCDLVHPATELNSKPITEITVDTWIDEIEYGTLSKKLAGCSSTKTYFWIIYDLVCKGIGCYCCIFWRGFVLGWVLSILALLLTIMAYVELNHYY